MEIRHAFCNQIRCKSILILMVITPFHKYSEDEKDHCPDLFFLVSLFSPLKRHNWPWLTWLLLGKESIAGFQGLREPSQGRKRIKGGETTTQNESTQSILFLSPPLFPRTCQQKMQGIGEREREREREKFVQFAAYKSVSFSPVALSARRIFKWGANLFPASCTL